MDVASIAITIISNTDEFERCLAELESLAGQFPSAVQSLLSKDPFSLIRLDSTVLGDGVLKVFWRPSSYLRGFVDALKSV